MSTTQDVTISRPLYLVISSDSEALNSVAGDLGRHYAPDYEVVRTTSAQEATEVFGQLAVDGRTVALALSSPHPLRQ